MAQTSCASDLKELVKLLLEKGISTQYILVGIGARNLVTQNGNGSIDFDYNLLIQKCDDIYDCRFLKETIRKCLNTIMKKQGLRDIQDSTSSLTTYPINFKDEPNLKFSMDVCIVMKDINGDWHRLIHKKTGIVKNDRYYWNKAPHSGKSSVKAKHLKDKNLWEEVRKCYLDKKNMYLKQRDDNHPSFICYIEAVNECFYKYFLK